VFVDFSRIFWLGILIFKGLTGWRLYKSFGVKRLIRTWLSPTGCLNRLVQTYEVVQLIYALPTFSSSFIGPNWKFRNSADDTDITISKYSISLSINYTKSWFHWNGLQVPHSESLHTSLMATSHPIRYHGTVLVKTSPLNNVIMQNGANDPWEHRNMLNYTIFKVVDCMKFTDVLSFNTECHGPTFYTVSNCQLFCP
jgi:hypothetical protein